MTPPEAINAAIAMAGISGRELARRLGHRDDGTVRAWRKGVRGLTVPKFAQVLSACNLSGIYTPDNGWTVWRNEQIRMPSEGE